MNEILKVEVSLKPRGLFLFIDDNEDEHLLMQTAMDNLGLKNKLLSFYDAQDALLYLKQTTEDIFVLICDIKMPRIDGLELKRIIELTPELKMKAIPMVFHSNTDSAAEIRAAFSLNIQGFFRKAPDISGTEDTLLRIIAYWNYCIHPQDIN